MHAYIIQLYGNSIQMDDSFPKIRVLIRDWSTFIPSIMGDIRAEIVLAMHVQHERPPFLYYFNLSIEIFSSPLNAPANTKSTFFTETLTSCLIVPIPLLTLQLLKIFPICKELILFTKKIYLTPIS